MSNKQKSIVILCLFASGAFALALLTDQKLLFWIAGGLLLLLAFATAWYRQHHLANSSDQHE